MDQDNFTIIFQKLADEAAAERAYAEPPPYSEALRAEIDEIAELRRLVLEITDPDPASYTTT